MRLSSIICIAAVRAQAQLSADAGVFSQSTGADKEVQPETVQILIGQLQPLRGFGESAPSISPRTPDSADDIERTSKIQIGQSQPLQPFGGAVPSIQSTNPGSGDAVAPTSNIQIGQPHPLHPFGAPIQSAFLGKPQPLQPFGHSDSSEAHLPLDESLSRSGDKASLPARSIILDDAQPLQTFGGGVDAKPTPGIAQSIILGDAQPLQSFGGGVDAKPTPDVAQLLGQAKPLRAFGITTVQRQLRQMNGGSSERSTPSQTSDTHRGWEEILPGLFRSYASDFSWIVQTVPVLHIGVLLVVLLSGYVAQRQRLSQQAKDMSTALGNVAIAAGLYPTPIHADTTYMQ